MSFKYNPFTGQIDKDSTAANPENIAVTSSQLIPISGIIEPLSIGIIDSNIYSTFFAVRYVCSFRSNSNKFRTFDYTLANDGLGSFKETVFASLFGGINVEVTTIIETGNIKFRIQNNETEQIVFKVHKLNLN